MKNIYDYLFNLLEEKRHVVLATIIETKGSSPQVEGASAIFSSEGLVEGTLGGGLLEADAQRKALRALKKQSSLVSTFSLDASVSSEEGAICGGKVNILIDASPEKSENTFRNLHQSFIRRQPGLLATSIKEFHEGVLLSRYWVGKEEKYPLDLEEPLSSFQKEIQKAFSENKPVLLKVKKELRQAEKEKKYLFLEPIFPLTQLVIAGAGHIGQAVAHLGNLLNFEVTVIDDRPEFANKEKVPDADHIIVGQIGKAIRNFPISFDTYMVIVTRGHHHDAEALRESIDSDASYIGMIGSARKIELMRKKFLDEGWATSRQWDRIHAPIGIDIGSKTVEEIALSIAAQLVLVRSQIQDKRKEA